MATIGSYQEGSTSYKNWAAEVGKTCWEHLYTVEKHGKYQIIIDAYDIEANLISTITDFLDSTASFPEPSHFENYVKTYKDIDDARQDQKLETQQRPYSSRSACGARGRQ